MSQLLQGNWLLLLHQIPPNPPYFRAKVLRKLNQLGALPIKNSAYLLPETTDNKEDLEWTRSEIEHEGGEAWLFRVEAFANPSDESLRESFRELRSHDYKQLLDLSAELLRSIQSPEIEAEPGFRKLQRKLEEVRRIDFFGAPGREEVETIMERISATIRPANQPAVKPALKILTNRTWVTRRGVKVDRIASAWLIRRFVDSSARFIFVDQDRYVPDGNQVRFDMFEGEFTHEGGLCTFEVLLQHSGLRNGALDAISQVIHDIDLKDDKHQLPETHGIAAMIDGIAALHADDERRIEEGSRLLDATYAAFAAARRVDP
jgi:hypothetical protein